MNFSQSLITCVNPILIGLLVLLVYLGYKKGFLSKLLSCLSFIVVVFISWNIAPALSKVFKILPESYAPYQESILADFFYQYANQIFIFVLIIILASICIFLLKPIVLLVQKLPVISFTNSFFGALFGLVEMTLLSFALLFVLHSPLVVNGQEVIDQTFFSIIEKIQNKVFLIGSDYLQDFDFMKETSFDEGSAQQLKEFLSEQGYSDEQIQQFFVELGK